MFGAIYLMIETILIKTIRHQVSELRTLGLTKNFGYFMILLIAGLIMANHWLSGSIDYSVSQFKLGITRGIFSLFRSLNNVKIFLFICIIGLVIFDGLFEGVIVGFEDLEEFGGPVRQLPAVQPTADLKMDDNQNVHNSSLSRHLAECIRRLREANDNKTPYRDQMETTYTQIREYIRASQHARSDEAIDTLDVIHNINGHHTMSDLSEMEILVLVWHRINSEINQSHLDDLKQSLLLQLADCKMPQGAGILCLTGRVARIVQSLECIDAGNIVDLKPLWAIREQIATYCSRYTDKLLPLLSENYREAFVTDSEKRTPEQKRLFRQYVDCVKKNLDRKFRKTYLDTKLLSEDQLNKLKESYYHGIDQL